MKRSVLARLRLVRLRLATSALLLLSVGMFGGVASGRNAFPLWVAGSQATWAPRPDDHSAVITSATTITLPDSDYTLVQVKVSTGTTPGSLSLLYNGVAKAHFPTGSDGTTGQMTWSVNWRPGSSTIPAGIQTFNGGLTQAVLTFSRGKSSGPNLDAYRALRYTVTTAATHATQTAFTSQNFDQSPGIPRATIVFGTVAGYDFYYPAVGGPQAIVDADFKPGSATVHRAPILPKATALVPFYTNTTAAGTLDAYVFYDPK